MPDTSPERGSRRKIGSIGRKIGRNSGQTNSIADVHSVEGWQLYQIVIRNAFQRVPRLSPRAQAAGDYEYFESEIL